MRRPLSADNAEMQIQSLGGVDESWLYISPLGIELAGAPLVGLVHQCAGLSDTETDTDLTNCLGAIANGLPAVHRAIARTYE
jgi:hypothetical protein